MSVTSNKLLIFIDGILEGMLKKILPGRYPLQPIFVEKAIEKAITENTKVFKNGVLPPDRISVMMSEEDYTEFKKIEGVYTRQLEQTAQAFIDNEFEEHSIGKSRTLISVVLSPEVAKGNLKIIADHHEAS